MRSRTALSAAIGAFLLVAAPATAFSSGAASSAPASAGSATTAATAATAAVTTDSATAASSTANSATTHAATLALQATATPEASREEALAAGPVKMADSAGSSEVKTVQRSCGAPRDTHYEPPEGKGLAACKNSKGQFDPNRKYTAKHFTNNVTCGTSKALAPSQQGLTISGDGGQAGTGGGGFLQVCSDGALPVQGRITAEGAVGVGTVNGTVTADGDRDNSASQAQGWAQLVISNSGPAVRCGESYEDGGRADASNPTSEDTQDDCG